MPEFFSLPATTAGIAELPGHLQVLSAWGLSAEQLREVNLIIEEICANCIEHGREDDMEIGVRLSLQGELLTMTISYPGPEFDPVRVADPDVELPLSERREGGLGLFLVRRFADRMTYLRENGLNIVTVTKRVTSTDLQGRRGKEHADKRTQ